jgi:hypothetical protein
MSPSSPEPDLDLPAIEVPAVDSGLAEALLAGIEHLSNAELQRLLAAAVHLYSTRMEEGEAAFRPFPPGVLPATTTDVIVVTTEMLRAVNIQLFELAMWQASHARF